MGRKCTDACAGARGDGCACDTLKSLIETYRFTHGGGGGSCALEVRMQLAEVLVQHFGEEGREGGHQANNVHQHEIEGRKCGLGLDLLVSSLETAAVQPHIPDRDSRKHST